MADVTLRLSYGAFCAVRGALEAYRDRWEAWGRAHAGNPSITEGDWSQQRGLLAQTEEAYRETERLVNALKGQTNA